MPLDYLCTRNCLALRQYPLSSCPHLRTDLSTSSAEQIGNEVIRTQWLCVVPPLSVTDGTSHILSAVVPKSEPSSADER